MFPSQTKQNTARLVENMTATEKMAFWIGYRAALLDARNHVPMELESMADMEIGHARKGMQQSIMVSNNLPRIKPEEN